MPPVVDHVVADDRDLALDAAGDLGDRGDVVCRPRLVHDREVGARSSPRTGRASWRGPRRARRRRRRRRVSPRSRKCCANSGSAVMWSTGMVKKPWIWPAWRSIVRTRSAPASWSMSATSRAEIGSRGRALRSWREYGNHGMTAVIRLAEASFAAWIMKQQLHQVPVDRLAPGLDDEDVGAADRLVVAAVRLAVRERLELDLAELHAELLGDPLRELRMRAAGEDHQPLLRRRARCQCPGCGSRRAGRDSRPGSRSVSSVVVAFHARRRTLLRDLPRRETGERSGRDVVGYDRSRRRSKHRRQSRPEQRRYCGLPVLTFLPIFVRCLGRPGSCGKFAVIAPAPMLVSSPMSASPM